MSSPQSITAQEELTITEVVTLDINAQALAQQGYRQQFDRTLSFWSLSALFISANGAWPSIAGALGIGIVQGGPCAIIYGLILTFVVYMITGTCVADLVSSIPTAAGPFHWVYVAASPNVARVLAYFTGWLNVFAWLFACLGNTIVFAQLLSGLIVVCNPTITVSRWATIIIYEGILLSTPLVTIFGHKYLKYVILYAGISLLVLFFIITPLVPAVAPTHRPSHFVWAEFINSTGWSSNAICFFIGLPNSFFGFGFLDVGIHLAEEAPRPQINIPKAIYTQYAVALPSGLAFGVAMFYSIQDIDGIINPQTGNAFMSLLQQACSYGVAIFLGLALILIALPSSYEAQVVASRMIWSFARDDGLPFSSILRHVDSRFKVPIRAILLCLLLTTIIGLMYVWADAAFNSLVSAGLIFHNALFTITFSVMAITDRKRLTPGPFHVPGLLGRMLFTVAALLMAFTVVVFCLPYYMPVTVADFNWNAVIFAGAVLVITVSWFIVGRKHFHGPSSHATVVEGVNGFNLKPDESVTHKQ